MNIYIMVDMEGISGIHTREQTKKDGLFYEDGRNYLTADVNACAEAKRFLPWVTTCVTKKALGHNQAVLDSPARGLENIRKTTIEAIRRMGECELYLLEKPIAFRRVIPSGTLEKTIDTVNDCIGP